MPAADQDIFDLNLSWLLKARELARLSQETALVVLGIDPAMAQRIAGLSLRELNVIAHTGVMLFHPRFPTKFWEELLSKGNQSPVALQFQTVLLASEEAIGS